MRDLFSNSDAINFGDLPDAINDLLQQGVAAYRHDHALADRLFRQAMVAARQAGWSPNWRDWSVQSVIPDGAGRFALYTLKALAFIRLRRSERTQALEILDALRNLDPAGVVGWPVVAALAEGTA